jgi:hypothetical protein
MLKRDINANLAELAQLLGMMKTELGMIKGPLSRAAKGAAKKAEKQKAGEKGEGGAQKEEEKGILRGEVDANQISTSMNSWPELGSGSSPNHFSCVL